MKKNISINLQGMIFHIEEDGYEQLSQYLAAVKAYFSAYEGHDEIVADIEARMAEIFFAKLSPNKQVITLEDVQALMTQMGSIQDFQTLEEDETTYASGSSSKQTGSSSQQNYSSASGSATSSSTASATAEGPFASRSIFTDQSRKVLGGVAAGIASYLNTNPLWIRLAIVLLTVLFAIPGGFPAGLVVVIYLLCWVTFPKNYSLPENTSKKLFRNPYDKKLGGVASGIALYFGMDVNVVRLIFLISFLAGGFSLLPYIILWIIVPEASSITDRVQMEGNPITLSSIEESIKENLRLKDEDGRESPLARAVMFPVRLVSQVLGVLARVLGPIISFLVALIRIFAGVLLMIIAGAGIFALVVLAATALHIFDGSEFIQTANIPFSLFANTFPAYGMVAGFFAGIIPCLFLLLLAFGLLLKRFYLRPALGWSLFAIWLLSGFVLALSIAQFLQNFQESGEYVEQKEFLVDAYPTVVLKNVRQSNSFRHGPTDVDVESYTGNTVKLIQTFRAKGRTEDEAIRNAAMISYRAEQQDSVLSLDNSFRYKPNAIWRKQDVDLKLLLPENKTFRVTEKFARMLPSSAFDRDYNNSELSRYKWQVKNNRFVCLNCPPPDTTGSPTAEPADIAWDNERTVLDSPLDNEADYGDNTRSFNLQDFRKIRVSGAYHLRVRPGNNFSVIARGNKKDVGNLIIVREGNELRIQPKREIGFGFSFREQNPVLITVEMPQLTGLDLSGAVKVDAAGFNSNTFELSASGAIESALAIRCKELNIDVSGACETTVAGSSNQLKLDASGACQFQAPGLRTVNADVELSGACSALVFVTNRLQAEVSGPSQLTYKGNPKTVDADQSGIGSIEPE